LHSEVFVSRAAQYIGVMKSRMVEWEVTYRTLDTKRTHDVPWALQKFSRTLHTLLTYIIQLII